jgi:hypothetical protein
MTDLATLEALRTRINAATGPDLELDGMIAKLAREIPPDAQFMRENIYGQDSNTWYTGGYGAYVYYNPEPYTALIDAALALVERLLPGWRWGLVHQQGGENSDAMDGYHFWLESPTGNDEHQIGPMATGPTAILAALLTALIAQQKGTTP